MLHFFSTFARVQRQQRALFRALAKWQNDPTKDLGLFGLSITTDIASPDPKTVTVQFTLHHSGGGSHFSGIVTYPFDSAGWDFAWLPAHAGPLLREFLMPTAMSRTFRNPSIPAFLPMDEPVA